MNLLIKHCFSLGTKAIGSSLVQKLAFDAPQGMRVKHRRDAVNEEPNTIENTRWEETE